MDAREPNLIVEILLGSFRSKKWISVSPFPPQTEPENLSEPKQELMNRWPLISLLDILKERTVTSRESLDRATLQRRLLLALYGLGTNTGLAQVGAGVQNETYANLMPPLNFALIKQAAVRTKIAAIAH